MTEYRPTGHDDHDATFFAMTQALRAEADWAAQIDKVLEDLAAAESWESMAIRSAARAQHHHRDLVPVPVIRRAT